MKKNIYFLKGGVFLALFLLISPFFSASLSDGMNEVGSYVEDYNSGKINSAQLIVYTEYSKNKIYESLDREGRKSFTEEEVQSAFDKIENKNMNDFKKSEYEKVFITDDFYIVFSAYHVYARDKEYYEEREEDTKVSYFIDYELRTNAKSSDNMLEEVEKFVSDLKELIENKDDEKFEEVRDEFFRIKSSLWKGNINQEGCEELMKDLGMEEINKETSSKEKFFYLTIKEKTEEKCWMGQECPLVCEEKEVCEACNAQCEEKEVCHDVCTDGEMNPETNQSPTSCVEKCSIQEVCEECPPEKCEMKENCYNKCEEKEECKDEKRGEIALEGKCREEGSDININAWGEGFDYYQKLNEGKDWNCQEEIDKFVELRKVLQKDVNDEFAKWFFEEFLVKEDYDKIINGENGFRKVLESLIRNEENIANSLSCSESKEWPKGFEKIEITYDNNNTHVEVWEKLIPIEWANTKYYTTLYKYSWIPDRELLKELINYKLSDSNTFGPTAKDIAKIKADEGQMALINSLSEKYGGSFDVKLELVDEKDKVVEKYLQVNPEVIIKISGDVVENPDISIEVEYDTLYNFINYISYIEGSNQIYGPSWVQIQGNEGPGKALSILGAVSKMWKEGVTIKPRYALLKMFFNTKEIVGLLSQESQESQESYSKKAVEVTGEVISKKE